MMKKVFERSAFATALIFGVYASFVLISANAEGGIYDAPSPSQNQQINRVNTNSIQQEAIKNAKKIEWEAKVEAARKEREKRAAEITAQMRARNSSGIQRNNAQRYQDNQVKRERHAYLFKQIPINEAKLLSMMSGEQKESYNEDKQQANWRTMSLEDRFEFINSYQKELDKQILEFQEDQRLESNFQ